MNLIFILYSFSMYPLVILYSSAHPLFLYSSLCISIHPLFILYSSTPSSSSIHPIHFYSSFIHPLFCASSIPPVFIYSSRYILYHQRTNTRPRTRFRICIFFCVHVGQLSILLSPPLPSLPPPCPPSTRRAFGQSHSCSSSVHPFILCSQCTSAVHPLSILCPTFVHLPCILYSSSVHPLFIHCPSSIHLHSPPFIFSSSSVILYSLSIHPPFIPIPLFT